MNETHIHYFMVDKKKVVPAEFHFFKCKTVDSEGTEIETTRWMKHEHWKELMDLIPRVLHSHLKDNKFPETEAILLSTDHLKLAYVFKLNNLTKQSIMHLGKSPKDSSFQGEATSTLASTLSQNDLMLIMNASLADSLNDIPGHTMKNSLVFSQSSTNGSKQPQISNYFAHDS